MSSSSCTDVSSTGLGTYGRIYTGSNTGNSKSGAVSMKSGVYGAGLAAAMCFGHVKIDASID